ncbi:4Fe-4S binding protein [Nocardia sp. R6R-6]|uniref:4Fe-4S binding protein n=1 Tax=Nocardia sp. R6R-6 TaxID=3459303 RepID=UPI00403D7DFF
MTHVILQHCCSDASCVSICPMNCIHPTPDEPEYPTAEMLYIDPDSCIDCGACVDACPIDAILPDDELSPAEEVFVDVNALWYADPAHQEYERTPPRTPAVTRPQAPEETLRVAVVGAGPTGLYAVKELLGQARVPVEVEVFERLEHTGGLARYGVAPDHPSTRSMVDTLAGVLRRSNVTLHTGVEVGRDVSPDDLRQQFHAVLVTVGAMHTRRLGIEGEDLTGSLTAGEFVAWYNDHPDARDLPVDLSGEHAVVIGNGNVALDVARILLTDPDRLAATDIAAHALEALRGSGIRRVTVLGRRGPREAAFTTPELMGLRSTPGIEVHCRPEHLDERPADDALTAHRLDLMRQLALTVPGGGRRVDLVFAVSPQRLHGADRVTGVHLVCNDLETVEDGRVVAKASTRTVDMDCSLVLNAAGFAGTAVPGLPWDERRCVVPSESGRVVDTDGLEVTGVYASGWIRRGPSGSIGSNRADAREVVHAVLDDFHAGRLTVRAETCSPGITSVPGSSGSVAEQ